MKIMEKESKEKYNKDFIAGTKFVAKDDIRNCYRCKEGQPCD